MGERPEEGCPIGRRYVFSVSFRASPGAPGRVEESRRYPCPDDEISCGHSGYSAPLALAFGEGSVELSRFESTLNRYPWRRPHFLFFERGPGRAGQCFDGVRAPAMNASIFLMTSG